MHLFRFISRLAHKGQGRRPQNLETSEKGNEDCEINFVNSLKNDINLLQNIVEEKEPIDSVVNNFSAFIIDRVSVATCSCRILIFASS